MDGEVRMTELPETRGGRHHKSTTFERPKGRSRRSQGQRDVFSSGSLLLRWCRGWCAGIVRRNGFGGNNLRWCTCDNRSVGRSRIGGRRSSIGIDFGGGYIFGASNGFDPFDLFRSFDLIEPLIWLHRGFPSLAHQFQRLPSRPQMISGHGLWPSRPTLTYLDGSYLLTDRLLAPVGIASDVRPRLPQSFRRIDVGEPDIVRPLIGG
jgi:hypothetical protein